MNNRDELAGLQRELEIVDELRTHFAEQTGMQLPYGYSYDETYVMTNGQLYLAEEDDSGRLFLIERVPAIPVAEQACAP